MKDYYSAKLSAMSLWQCYELAPPRIQQYMKAEADHVVNNIHNNDLVLELGCGYGRLLPFFAAKARMVIGIDTSRSSILLGRKLLSDLSNCMLLQMNAIHLAFPDNMFDVVVCIQNGISAFHVDQELLIRESIRVTKNGGKVLFSSYSEKIWQQRLEWFHRQSAAGLLGEIDTNKTREGTIVCHDGFTATTVGPEQFKTLTKPIKNIKVNIVEVDESSLFCEIIPVKK
ncbi:MAG: class I SAM-dependent methyltransferase [Bacteroidetes bacterium]|nr:class I SAM-dependent methyltransferase [Bacteroidota bacterium]